MTSCVVTILLCSVLLILCTSERPSGTGQVPSQGSTGFDKRACISQSPCTSSPCLNGGTCSTIQGYTCQCDPAYAGSNCEFNLSCASRSCTADPSSTCQCDDDCVFFNDCCPDVGQYCPWAP